LSTPTDVALVAEVARTQRGEQQHDVVCSCHSPFERSEDGYRLIWIRSSQKARSDQRARQQTLANAQSQFAALAAKLNRGKLRTRTAIRNAITAILRKNGIRRCGSLTVSLAVQPPSVPPQSTRRLRSRKGRRRAKLPCYSIRVTLNRDALKREARTDGVYPLITNLDSSFGKRAVAEMYKYQPYIEKRFAALKSELVVAPVFLKKTVRVVGMLHVYFIAIALASLIERTVRGNMHCRGIKQLVLLPEERSSTTPTCPRLLETFANVSWYECQQKDQRTAVSAAIG
jgi:transposase